MSDYKPIQPKAQKLYGSEATETDGTAVPRSSLPGGSGDMTEEEYLRKQWNADHEDGTDLSPRPWPERRKEIEATLDSHGWITRADLCDCLAEIDRLERELGGKYLDAAIQHMDEKEIHMQQEIDRLKEHDNWGWRGLANLYSIITGKKCKDTIALGMATGAVVAQQKEINRRGELIGLMELCVDASCFLDAEHLEQWNEIVEEWKKRMDREADEVRRG